MKIKIHSRACSCHLCYPPYNKEYQEALDKLNQAAYNFEYLVENDLVKFPHWPKKDKP